MLTVSATATTALAGVVFNALLITRAPLQLFQAIQTSLLPHLAGLEATEGHEAFARAIRVTVLAIAAFAGAVALGLLLIGPWAMDVVFGDGYDYGRVGLAVIAVGMGFHLCAGTLNQAALARGHARAAATMWLVCAALFVVWMVVPAIDDELLRAEVGYAAGCRAVVRCCRARSADRGCRRCAPDVADVGDARTSNVGLPGGDRRARHADLGRRRGHRHPAPGVEVTTSYGTPSLKVAGGFMCRLRTDPDALVLRVADLGEREALLQGQPDAFFTTPHYDGHPSVLVRLEVVDPAELAELLEEAWRLRAPKRLVARRDAAA